MLKITSQMFLPAALEEVLALDGEAARGEASPIVGDPVLGDEEGADEKRPVTRSRRVHEDPAVDPRVRRIDQVVAAGRKRDGRREVSIGHGAGRIRRHRVVDPEGVAVTVVAADDGHGGARRQRHVHRQQIAVRGADVPLDLLVMRLVRDEEHERADRGWKDHRRSCVDLGRGREGGRRRADGHGHALRDAPTGARRARHAERRGRRQRAGAFAPGNRA